MIDYKCNMKRNIFDLSEIFYAGFSKSATEQLKAYLLV